MTAEDRERTFAVIATGGTTNAGIIDDLEGIASVCKKEGIWFHVDSRVWRSSSRRVVGQTLFKGIGEADSVTIDPHKWLFAPYDCGAIIYRKPELAKKASLSGRFVSRHLQRSRLERFQSIRLSNSIDPPCPWTPALVLARDARHRSLRKGHRARDRTGKDRRRNDHETSHTELVRDPSLSCVLFRRFGWSPEDYRDWTYKNHKSGIRTCDPNQASNVVRSGDSFAILFYQS
jgi:glutamate/tyrosine decarboxylase-like PLP-dependent enzyme